MERTTLDENTNINQSTQLLVQENVQPRQSTWKKHSKTITDFALKHWFILVRHKLRNTKSEGLILSIGLAAAYPPLGKKGGHLRTEYSVKYGVVALIFVITGLSLKTHVLLNAFTQVKLHVFIQLLSLGVFPAIGCGFGKLLGLSPSFDKTIADGIIIACCTPTTISSNVLMTKQSGGNEPGAIVNAVMGNVIGVFLSPALIYAYLGTKNEYGTFDYSKVFTDLSITVIGPLVLGQLLLFIFPNITKNISRYVSLPIVNSCLLLILVWSVFCDTFASQEIKSVQATSLAPLIFIDLALFLLFSAISFYGSRIPLFKFAKFDSVAILMCAATKTVALGIPMISIIFGSSPKAGILSVPLLIYHAEQLVVGSIFVSFLSKWTRPLDQTPV